MEFIFLATAHFLALLSPGPDFFLIVQASLRLPRRYGLAICIGIALANGVYLLLAVIGFEMVREMTLVFSAMKYLGAAYLLFLGFMLLRAPNQPIGTQQSRSFVSAESVIRQFLIGFMSAILNPKNMIFYLSLFTALVSAETGFLTRCLYALWMMSVVFVWDCLVVLTIGRKRVKRWLGHSIFYLEKLSGGALACFGILLPFT